MTEVQAHSNNSVMFIANSDSDNAAQFAASRWRMKGDATEVVVEKPWTNSIYDAALRKLKKKVSERGERGENVTLIGTGAEGYLVLEVAAELPVTAVTICTEFDPARLGEDISAKFGLGRFKESLDNGKLKVAPDRVINVVRRGRERTQTLTGASVLRIEENGYRPALSSISSALMEQGLEYTIPLLIESEAKKRLQQRRERAVLRQKVLGWGSEAKRERIHEERVLPARAYIRS